MIGQTASATESPDDLPTPSRVPVENWSSNRGEEQQPRLCIPQGKVQQDTRSAPKSRVLSGDRDSEDSEYSFSDEFEVVDTQVHFGNGVTVNRERYKWLMTARSDCSQFCKDFTWAVWDPAELVDRSVAGAACRMKKDAEPNRALTLRRNSQPSKGHSGSNCIRQQSQQETGSNKQTSCVESHPGTGPSAAQ